MSYSVELPDGTILGNVPGIEPGTFFRDRQELHDKRLHRMTVQGISKHGSSVVLSGGYEDDEERADGSIIYTGEGGRKEGAKDTHVADQTLTGGNAALAQNHLNGVPVRVQLHRKFVPGMPKGFLYRYEGLYSIVRYWTERRKKDGFLIYRFQLERAIESTVISEEVGSKKEIVLPAGNIEPKSRTVRIVQTIRATKVTDSVKEIHDHSCQICSTRLTTPGGAYAQGCHIKPIGRPHKGPDIPQNVLTLCPNCHVLFDELAIWIEDDLTLRGAAAGKLRTHPSHKISEEFLRYHRGMAGH